MTLLTSIAENAIAENGASSTTKWLDYYKIYDRFLTNHEIRPRTILEIGVFKGESTKILAQAFPEAKIVSVDLQIQDIDFSNYPNVIYLQANQSDAQQMSAILERHFPDGIDLVIDDASHVGYISKLTFDIVFPALKSGGAYFIEDWGTGYWDSWPDGSRYQVFLTPPHSGNLPQRIPSHDYGMVGFVKSLVDMTHEEAIKNNHGDKSKYQSRIKLLEFGEGVCMALKA